MACWILLLSIFFPLLFLLFQQRRKRSTSFPSNWPILGMLPGFLMQVHRIHDWCIELLTESPNFTFMFHGPWFSKMHLLFTCDPANINHIFNLNVSNYPKGENFKDIFDILGDGLITTDSESWKNQRKLARLSMAKSRFHSAVGSCTLEKMNNTLLPLLNKMAVDSTVPHLS